MIKQIMVAYMYGRKEEVKQLFNAHGKQLPEEESRQSNNAAASLQEEERRGGKEASPRLPATWTQSGGQAGRRRMVWVDMDMPHRGDGQQKTCR